jgi:condensin complex subunit 2
MDDGEGAMGDAGAGEQDLLASTEGRSRRVRPEFVNYAKRAKRVDVRKLKDNIWKGLKIVIPQSDGQDMVSEYVHFFLDVPADEMYCRSWMSPRLPLIHRRLGRSAR